MARGRCLPYVYPATATEYARLTGPRPLLTDWAARLRVRLREVRLSSRPPEHGEIEGEIASRSVVRKSHAKEAARSPRIHW